GSKGPGGMKKSLALIALPKRVPALIRPDVPAGTVVEIVVAVDEVACEWVMLKDTLLLAVKVSKLVPVMFTGVPGVPIVGLKPVPWIVTVVPTGPLWGLNSRSAMEEEPWRAMERRFPTAS